MILYNNMGLLIQRSSLSPMIDSLYQNHIPPLPMIGKQPMRISRLLLNSVKTLLWTTLNPNLKSDFLHHVTVQ